MARPRKPAGLRVLQGARRASRSGEPEYGPLPERPGWLTGEAAAEWDRVAALLAGARVLTAADATALALLAAAYGEYRAAEAAIREHGMVYTTETESGSVMVRPRPEVQIRSDAWRRYRSLLPEFGLSPASRSRVEPAGPAEVENPVAAWRRKHGV